MLDDASEAQPFFPIHTYLYITQYLSDGSKETHQHLPIKTFLTINLSMQPSRSYQHKARMSISPLKENWQICTQGNLATHPLPQDMCPTGV